MVRVAVLLLGGAAMLAAGLIAVAYLVRPGMERYAQHRYVAPRNPGAVTAAWYGVTAVLISDGTTRLFIDPYFTRAPGLLNMLGNKAIAPDEPAIGRWLERAGATRLDAVLVSHSHFDHAMDAGVVARLSGARLLGSASTANIGRGAGLEDARLQVVRSSEPLAFGAFKVTFVESRHAGATGGTPTGDITQPLAPPAHYMDYRQGGTYSILVEHPEGTVLHHGSAGVLPGALRLRRADVVMLGIALMTDTENYLAETVDAVGASRVMPVHWDDFTRPLAEPLEPFPVMVRLPRFFDEMERLRPKVTVQTLELAQPVALFSVRP